ncbi:exosortase/archaeosortase family protein [Roseiarcus fermentans]|uniref:Exosortase/archaeosortase family protein n=1 Tax=Roseiarcus fermentans TaxID=1473586 RepID=A0A366FID2_9HYPH|nr:archaeosortase/exosortase family protein [Roseiarcus fermentans]RBP13740.1 exosortase/archaeosortase family protein [Roseiarcus fermentans]
MTVTQPSAAAALRRARVGDREIVLAFVVGVAVAISWRSVVAWSHGDFSAVALRDHSGVGAGELLALGVLAYLGLGIGRDDLLTRSDLAVMAACSLAFAFPMRMAAAVPLIVAGLKLLFHKNARISSIGQVLLALVGYEWLGPLLFHLVSPTLLEIETTVVQAALAPLNGGFARDGLAISAPTWSGVVVEEGCSAFHNISLSTLIWISLLKLQTLTMRSVYVLIALAMAAATILLNTLRIVLMAQSPELYDYWHNGAGVPIVTFVMLAVALVLCLGGMRLAAAR